MISRCDQISRSMCSTYAGLLSQCLQGRCVFIFSSLAHVSDYQHFSARTRTPFNTFSCRIHCTVHYACRCDAGWSIRIQTKYIKSILLDYWLDWYWTFALPYHMINIMLTDWDVKDNMYIRDYDNFKNCCRHFSFCIYVS